MSVARYALEHTKLAHALFLILVAIGIFAWLDLPIEVYPEVRASSAVAVAVWPGATAQQVEQFVTNRIEEQIEGLRHVEWYRSESTANLSRVVVRFDSSASEADTDSAFAALQSRINQITDLPEGCEAPVVSRFKLNEDSPFLRLCVTDVTGRGRLEIRRVARELKEELSDLPGVAGVLLLGEGKREVRVSVDRTALEDAGMTLSEVTAVIRRTVLSMPLGAIKSDREEYPIRFVADLKAVEELGNIIVRKDPTGAHIYLRDVASFQEGLTQDFIRARYQGNRCVVVEVTKTSGTNIVAVRDRVLQFLDRYQGRDSMEGIQVAVASDITPWVSNALSVMQQNLLAGCVLVLIVLGVSLGIRNSVLAMLGIPFAFLCTLTCMRALEITINTASVFALVLVSGLIVDDAIVVLENVYRHMQKGGSRRDAIIHGMSEVLPPLCAATVTTVVAFLPILLIRGGLGSLFVAVPKLVAIALLASLFECLIILPGHILHWGPRGAARRDSGEVSPARGPINWLGNAFVGAYLFVLESLLRLRYLGAMLLVAIVALAWAAAGLVRVEALPAEFPMALINFETDREASLDATDTIGVKLCGVLEEVAGEDGAVKNYINLTGMQLTEHEELIRQTNLGMIWVQFHPTATARRDPEAMLQQLRDLIGAWSDRHPDMGLKAFSVAPMGTGLASREAVAIRVEHHDLAVCRRAADRIRHRMTQIPGVTQVRDNMRQGPLQLHLRALEPECSEYGLTVLDVAGTVRAANEGLPAGSLRDTQSSEEVPIRVLLDAACRDNLDDLLAIRLKAPTGAQPRLGDVAESYYDQDVASLYHYHGRRLITVGASLEGAPVDAEGRPIDIRYVNRAVAQEFPTLEQTYPGLKLTIGGGYAQRQETFGSLALAGLVAAAMIYLVLLTQFRSYLQPLLVLLTLLFAFVGVVLGLCVHGYTFSVVTAVSLVGLFGVAVNDAIILVDFINKAPRDATGDRLKPVLEGCRLRLRPILVTTITTVAGLLPMAVGFRGFSTIWSPFAACFCYGLSTATLLTLLVLPGLYLACDDLGRLGARLFGQKHGAEPQ